MERNSTIQQSNWQYDLSGERSLKTFLSRKSFLLGSQFSQKDLERVTNVWVTNGKDLVHHPRSGSSSALSHYGLHYTPWPRCPRCYEITKFELGEGSRDWEYLPWLPTCKLVKFANPSKAPHFFFHYPGRNHFPGKSSPGATECPSKKPSPLAKLENLGVTNGPR